MAKREGQGLQIAVIIFAMLTIILAITTYVFFAQSQTAQKDLDSKTKQMADLQGQVGKLNARLTVMKAALGVGDVTPADVELAKGQAGDDAEVKLVLDQFAQDMALIGDQVPDGTKSYRTMMTVLKTSLEKKNASLADLNQQMRDMTAAKDKAVQDQTQRAQVAVDSADKAKKDYEEQGVQFTAFRTQMDEEKAKLATQITKTQTDVKGQLATMSKEKDDAIKGYATQQSTISDMRKRMTDLEKRVDIKDLFEHPDGRIKLVNQRQRLVWIDVGSADGLMRQTTFSIYDHDENGVSSAKSKGRIEVVSLGDHLSEARILDDTPANPIIAGDIIHTPAWSPGQRVHFALAMKMDINKDRIDDYDMVKNIIQMNGGVIDAELRPNPDGTLTRTGDITVNTRYFVQGEKPGEATNPKLMDQFNAFAGERDRYGVETISVDKLLSLMGWKAEEKVVTLAGPRASGGGDFRKRAPGKTQPAATAPATESPGTPPPPAATDPFAPGAAPAAPARPAPGADTDPFAVPAAPAAKPAAGADTDPFAAPK